MKRLFETADLEAEVFLEEENLPEESLVGEYDVTEEMAEDLVVLEDFSEADLEEFPALELSLELSDGRILEYEAVGVFVHAGKEYMALHPKTDTEGMIHIMQLTQGEDDEIRLRSVEDDAELAAVSEAFYELLGDEDSGGSFHESEGDEDSGGSFS